MEKKVVITIIALLLIVIVYNAVMPMLGKPKPAIEDPKLAKAILEFAEQQMQAENLKLPADLQDWKADTIEIIKIEELPGAQGFRKATVTLKGSYLAAGEKDRT